MGSSTFESTYKYFGILLSTSIPGGIIKYLSKYKYLSIIQVLK